MAKLLVLMLAFSAIVALATAHKTIITTTTVLKNDESSRHQCKQQLKEESFNQCQNYLQLKKGLQECCQELRKVDKQCQCQAVKQVFWQVQQQQQQQQQPQKGQQGDKSSGSKQIKKLKKIAQKIPDECNFQPKQCKTEPIVTTTIIEDTDNNPIGYQSCHETIEKQRFNQCQRYIEQQSGGYSRTLLMSFNRQGLQQPRALEQCCNELQKVDKECMCEVMQEVYKKAMWQQQQEGSQQHGRRGEWRQQRMEEVRWMIQNLPNRCEIYVEQCQIPSSMF